jgi:hypothetical protein
MCLGSPVNSSNGVPAVFLDRDGVINLDSGYVHRVADLQAAERAALSGSYLVGAVARTGRGTGSGEFEPLVDVVRHVLGKGSCASDRHPNSPY